MKGVFPVKAPLAENTVDMGVGIQKVKRLFPGGALHRHVAA
ncbi:MAG: hypothetical protein AB9903_05180 [Vulcanimicrobiota bacterium]